VSVHYLDLVPLRLVDGAYTDVACWLDPYDAVAIRCACGWHLRLADPLEDLGVTCLAEFYGEVSLRDERLDRLTADLDSSEHAAVMVPALEDLWEPAEPPRPSTGEQTPLLRT
jgi:hypothetical protein